jgi:cobalamin biosynthesis protein CbiG
MDSGIVVHSIASLLQDKTTDPAIVVLDEKGLFAVSLAGGHLAGANSLAEKVTELIGGQAVITTSYDVNDLPTIDLWAERLGLVIEEKQDVAKEGTKLSNRGEIRVRADLPHGLPTLFGSVRDQSLAYIIVTEGTNIIHSNRNVLVIHPRSLILGIGCNSRTTAGEINHVPGEVPSDVVKTATWAQA